jgi:hypothetical protein
VFRTRSGDALDSARVRRAAWISTLAAVVVLAGLVVLQLAFGWAGDTAVRPVVVVVLVAAGLGLVLFACFPTASLPDPAATINGRQVRPDERLAARGSVQQYLQRRQRPVPSADREAVLTDVPLVQRALMRRVARLGPLGMGVVLLGVAGALAGANVLSFAGFIAYVLIVPGMISSIGVAERARLAALAAPPLPDGATGTPTPGWQRNPTGSKIRLPGD